MHTLFHCDCNIETANVQQNCKCRLGIQMAGSACPDIWSGIIGIKLPSGRQVSKPTFKDSAEEAAAHDPVALESG